MSLFKTLRLVGRGDPVLPPTQPKIGERRTEERRAVFQEAVLLLDERFKLRVVITNISAKGACIKYAGRMDLPCRVRLISMTGKLNCWVRVAWQDDGVAGLEFQPD